MSEILLSQLAYAELISPKPHETAQPGTTGLFAEKG